MRHSWRWLVFSMTVSCGYSATPIELLIDTLARDTGELKTLTALGIADPAASGFDDGAMLSTRWASQRANARTLEMHIDLDLSNLPGTLTAGRDDAVELTGDDVRFELIQRRLDGTVALTHVPASARVTVIARKSESARELSAGRFQMSMPDEEGAAYVHVQGTWQSMPPPPRVTDVTGYPPGDFSPGDPHPGDPNPGDPNPGDPQSGDPAVQPAGDNDTVVFDSGCSCPGGDYEEDLPEEEEPDPQPAPEDTGGCDCVDTTGPDEPEPEPDPTEPDPDVVRDDTGCDCVGDPGPDEDVPVEPDPDPTTDDTSTDTGCDCEGDPGPDEPVDEWAQASVTGSMLASYSETPRPAKKSRKRRRRCRRSPLRIGLELSPIFFLYLLSRWRRRQL